MNTFIKHYFHQSCDPFTCPICAEEAQEEDDRIDKLTTEEIRAELIEAGCDPDAMVMRVKALISSYKEKINSRLK
jgi:hypothetical protein